MSPRALDPLFRARNFPRKPSPRRVVKSDQQRLRTVERQVVTAMSVAVQPAADSVVETVFTLPPPTGADLGRQIILRSPDATTQQTFIGTLLSDGSVGWLRVSDVAVFGAGSSFVRNAGMGAAGVSGFSLSGIAFSVAGTRAYVTNNFSTDDYVLRYDVSGNVPSFLDKFGGAGSANGDFNGPAGLCVDSSTGDIFVCDAFNDRIQRFGAGGGYISKFGTSGSGNGQFDKPGAICQASNRDLYVIDIQNDRIQQFSVGGSFIRKWDTTGNGNGEFNFGSGNTIVDICVDDDDNVYALDVQNDRIQKFTKTGAYLTDFGHKGSGLGSSDYVGIDFYNGLIYACDAANNRVISYTTKGARVDVFGQGLEGSGAIDDPNGMKVNRTNGRFFVLNATSAGEMSIWQAPA
jgi:hypothetical protein